MSTHDAGVLCEGRAIQRQSIWCAGLSCLSRSSNQTNKTDQRDQMNQLPATSREILLGTFSIQYDNARRSRGPMVVS